MLVTYGDLAKRFPKIKGIRDHELCFHTITTISAVPQHKGLFIPIHNTSGELKEAIENGAVAALWNEMQKVPHYTPNHFPIFFTNDLLKGLKDMMELYLKQLKQNNFTLNEVTRFLITQDSLIQKNDEISSLAVMAEQINNLNKNFLEGEEGVK